MGSIGAGSNSVKGITVTLANNKTMRYEERGGTVYNVSGVNPQALNMSLSDIQKRAESQGLKYQTLTGFDLAKQEEVRKKEKSETERQLNQAYVGDKTFVKGSRASRVTNRVNKRK